MSATTPHSRRKDVLLFGPQAALAGTRSVSVSIEPGCTTCAAVLTAIGEGCEVLQPSLATSRLAVDQVLRDRDFVLHGHEELALIGMVGGG